MRRLLDLWRRRHGRRRRLTGPGLRKAQRSRAARRLRWHTTGGLGADLRGKPGSHRRGSAPTLPVGDASSRRNRWSDLARGDHAQERGPVGPPGLADRSGPGVWSGQIPPGSPKSLDLREQPVPPARPPGLAGQPGQPAQPRSPSRNGIVGQQRIAGQDGIAGQPVPPVGPGTPAQQGFAGQPSRLEQPHPAARHGTGDRQGSHAQPGFAARPDLTAHPGLDGLNTQPDGPGQPGGLDQAGLARSARPGPEAGPPGQLGPGSPARPGPAAPARPESGPSGRRSSPRSGPAGQGAHRAQPRHQGNARAAVRPDRQPTPRRRRSPGRTARAARTSGPGRAARLRPRPDRPCRGTRERGATGSRLGAGTAACSSASCIGSGTLTRHRRRRSCWPWTGWPNCRS